MRSVAKRPFFRHSIHGSVWKTTLSSNRRWFATQSQHSPLRITLIGVPGSGKGTQATRLQADYGITALSTGHLLRTEVANGTPLGKRAAEQMKDGGLVCDAIMMELIESTLGDPKYKSGWVLDGFPRTTKQAEHLDNFLARISQPLTVVLYIKVDKNIIVDRLKDRLVHLPSGRTYNLQYNPPKVKGKDDITGEDLVQREDDKPETIMKRLVTYEESTKPLLDYYRSQKLLVEIPSPNSDVGYENIKKVLSKYTEKE